MPLPFTKMQGAGNDFVVVRGDDHDWSALAPTLCSRRTGVGADGVLAALPSDRADVRLRMFNPDGTEDECGNGLRCLALYARRRGLVAGDSFRVETLSGIKAVRVQDGPAEALVTAGMGRAVLLPERVPVRVEGERALGFPLVVAGRMLELHALSTGTTHTVIFHMPDDEEFREVSPRLETHPLFPERTTVMWAALEGAGLAHVRIWERGAGETLACGTGACAVAVAAYLSGRAGPRLRVRSRGGTLEVEVGAELELRMTGPAAEVYEGTWE